MMRPALTLSLAAYAAFAVWTLGRLALGDQAQAVGVVAAGSLLMLQGVLLVIMMPWLAGGPEPQKLMNLAALVAVPWPLFALALNISDLGPVHIVASQLWLTGIVLLSYFISRVLLRALHTERPRTLVATVLQLAPAVLLWAVRDTWIPWFVS